jgi:hypothetical protein
MKGQAGPTEELLYRIFHKDGISTPSQIRDHLESIFFNKYNSKQDELDYIMRTDSSLHHMCWDTVENEKKEKDDEKEGEECKYLSIKPYLTCWKGND